MSDWWSGTPPTTSMTGMTPWIQAPSYRFSSALYDYMSRLIGQPAPRFPGGNQFRQMGAQSAGPAIGPEMNAMMGLGRRYMQTGMPTVFGAGIGSLGRFMAPQFTNPVARMQMGAPNYFGSQMTPPVPGAFGGGAPGGGMGYQTGGGMQWQPPQPSPMPMGGGGFNPPPDWRQRFAAYGGPGQMGGNFAQY